MAVRDLAQGHDIRAEVLTSPRAIQPLGSALRVIPVLIYPDPAVAAEWLSKAFGVTVRLGIANHRIQMKADG